MKTRLPFVTLLNFLLVSGILAGNLYAQTSEKSVKHGNRLNFDIKLDASAAGELLRHSSSSPQLDEKSTFLRSAELSVPLIIRWRSFEAQTFTSIRRSATSHESGTHILGKFRVGINRQNVSAFLGVQQRVGAGAGPNGSNQFPADSQLLGLWVDSARERPGGLLKQLDLVGSAGVGIRNYHVEATAGMPTRGIRKPWVGIDGSMALQNAIVFLSFRSQSMKVESPLPAVMFGIRTSLWRAGTGIPIVKPDRSGEAKVTQKNPQSWSGDTVTISINRPDVSEVMIAGDATDWNPVAMEKGDDGWWSLTLCVKNSISRIHMRTDKEDWSPIPGLPRSRNEYGGFVSLLIADKQK